ncbi:MAG: ABC transporter ATP-binding protein [Caldilineaceae bacterium]
MSELRIKATDLHKTFGHTRAVDGVSLHVAAGEIYGLVGPDGAGKTTLLRLLCGALQIEAGEVTLGQFNVKKQAEQARAQLGYLAQRFALYEDLTVIENLRFFAELRGLPANEWEPRSREILEFVELAKFSGRRAGQLSGGMKQKLGLALALVNRPQILLLDEPTTGVDPVTRQDFWRLIIALLQRESIAVLVSTPYMDEAIRCTRIGFMRNGRVIAEGTPAELRARYAGRILELAGEPQTLLTSVAKADPDVESLQRFGNRLHAQVRAGQTETVAARLRENILAAGGQVDALRLIEAQLEDVFIAMAEEQA